MENFNGTLNGEQQEQTSVVKGIIFAIIGMLIGMIPSILILGFTDYRISWIAAAVVGICVSGGWHIGKGSDGGFRQITMILLSIIGSVIAVILGYAIFYYNLGVGFDFMHTVEIIIEEFFYGFGDLFHEHSIQTRDALISSAVAIAVSWKKFDKSGNGDLEELDNGLEDIDANNVVENSTSAMDEALNQDVPTLDIDENWNN